MKRKLYHFIVSIKLSTKKKILKNTWIFNMVRFSMLKNHSLNLAFNLFRNVNIEEKNCDL